MKIKQVPVLLLTGYLGSGKTTLLNRILTNERGLKFAVIVNDIGDVNIDARLIQKGGVVGSPGGTGDDLVALQNGCICCSLKMDLVKQVADLLSTGRFDYIVIEASGICEPAPIAQTICTMSTMPGVAAHGSVPVLDAIVTVVDALRLKSEFGCGGDLDKEHASEGDLARLVIEQIEFCNVVILNKISEVSDDEAAHIKAVIKALQPQARIIECDYCDVDIEGLVGTGMFDFESVATSATWIREIEKPVEEEDHHDHDHGHHGHHEHHEPDHHGHHDHDDHECGPDCQCGHHHHHGHSHTEEYGIETMTYYRRKAFDLNKFDYFVAKHWPAGIIRAKGICYFSVNRDMSYLFEQAGIQKNLSEAGRWYATAPAEELAQMMAADPALRRDWDSVYGDRMNKLVFIGRNLDRDALTEALDACLES